MHETFIWETGHLIQRLQKTTPTCITDSQKLSKILPTIGFEHYCRAEENPKNEYGTKNPTHI